MVPACGPRTTSIRSMLFGSTGDKVKLVTSMPSSRIFKGELPLSELTPRTEKKVCDEDPDGRSNPTAVGTAWRIRSTRACGRLLGNRLRGDHGDWGWKLPHIPGYERTRRHHLGEHLFRSGQGHIGGHDREGDLYGHRVRLVADVPSLDCMTADAEITDAIVTAHVGRHWPGGACYPHRGAAQRLPGATIGHDADDRASCCWLANPVRPSWGHRTNANAPSRSANTSSPELFRTSVRTAPTATFLALIVTLPGGGQ